MKPERIYTLSIMAAAFLLVAIIALISSPGCHAQAACPPHKEEFVKTIKKPVRYNQLVCPLATCDQDQGQTLSLSIIKGDAKKLFKIGAGGLLVNNATAINRANTRLYTITVQVQDNGTNPGPLSRTSIIKLTVTK